MIGCRPPSSLGNLACRLRKDACASLSLRLRRQLHDEAARRRLAGSGALRGRRRQRRRTRRRARQPAARWLADRARSDRRCAPVSSRTPARGRRRLWRRTTRRSRGGSGRRPAGRSCRFRRGEWARCGPASAHRAGLRPMRRGAAPACAGTGATGAGSTTRGDRLGAQLLERDRLLLLRNELLACRRSRADPGWPCSTAHRRSTAGTILVGVELSAVMTGGVCVEPGWPV